MGRPKKNRLPKIYAVADGSYPDQRRRIEQKVSMAGGMNYKGGNTKMAQGLQEVNRSPCGPRKDDGSGGAEDEPPRAQEGQRFVS